jgi:hypothetical protein
MSVVIKTVRVRGRISTEGDYWKNPAPNSLGMGDLVLTLEKSGRKDYNVIIRTIHVKKNSEGEYLQQPNTVYSTIGNPGSESFGGYPSIYGSSFDIEPNPSNDVYKTTDDFITKFISNRNLPANLKQNYGRPSSGDSFRSYYAGLTQAPPFYEIIQDPFDPTSVPVHPEGYFDIWNQWVLEINTPVFRSELPTSQIGGTPSQISGTPSQIGGTPSTTGLSQSILLNVVFPSEFEVKVREDVPKFKIWVGDPQPEEQVDGFILNEFEQTDEEGNVIGLGDEYIESEYSGVNEVIEMELRVDLQSESISESPPKTENLSLDFNDPKFIGGDWKKYNIDTLISEISKTSHAPNNKFKDSLKKILLWIKKDKDITDVREASYLLGTAYAEAGYSLQRWESDYLGKGIGIPYGPDNPIPKSALNYYRSTKDGKKNYYDLGVDSKGLPYFGRGLIQLTGKANYEKYGDKIGVNLASNADLALNEENSYKISVIFLTRSDGPFKYAKSGDLKTARKRVNGGKKGLDEVNGAYNDWLKIFNKSIS